MLFIVLFVFIIKIVQSAVKEVVTNQIGLSTGISFFFTLKKKVIFQKLKSEIYRTWILT